MQTIYDDSAANSYVSEFHAIRRIENQQEKAQAMQAFIEKYPNGCPAVVATTTPDPTPTTN